MHMLMKYAHRKMLLGFFLFVAGVKDHSWRWSELIPDPVCKNYFWWAHKTICGAT